MVKHTQTIRQQFQKAKKLKEEKGIVAYTDYVKRKKLSQEELLSVGDFYWDCEFSI